MAALQMTAPKVAAPRMAASWIVIVISSHFAVFGQVKNLIVTLLTLDKSKISLTTKLLWEKLDA